MNRFLFVLFVILTFYSVFLLAKKKKKTVAKKPAEMDDQVWCNSCQAIVRETLKKLKYKKSEADVFEALEDVCQKGNFYVYDFPPPEMQKGCFSFMEVFQETLEINLTKRPENNEEAENKICIEITKACEGVDMTKKKKGWAESEAQKQPDLENMKMNPEKPTKKPKVLDPEAEKIDL